MHRPSKHVKGRVDTVTAWLRTSACRAQQVATQAAITCNACSTIVSNFMPLAAQAPSPPPQRRHTSHTPSAAMQRCFLVILPHLPADHYTGLSESWRAGPIYCSPITAALAQHLCGVPAAFLRPLALNTPHTIPEQPGVSVVLVDANHCPGAVQLLFMLQDGRRYLHCGDMRYRPAMKEDAQLQAAVGVDAVFLDTTYCHPRHLFPPQVRGASGLGQLWDRTRTVSRVNDVAFVCMAYSAWLAHAQSSYSIAQPCSLPFVCAACGSSQRVHVCCVMACAAVL